MAEEKTIKMICPKCGKEFDVPARLKDAFGCDNCPGTLVVTPAQYKELQKKKK